MCRNVVSEPVKTAIHRETKKKPQNGAEHMFHGHVAVRNENTDEYGEQSVIDKDVAAGSRVHERRAWCHTAPSVSAGTAEDGHATKMARYGADRAIPGTIYLSWGDPFERVSTGSVQMG
jgi:hypothetical protein